LHPYSFAASSASFLVLKSACLDEEFADSVMDKIVNKKRIERRNR